MGRVKQLNDYPREYGKLFWMAARKAVIVTYHTSAQALSARNELYQYRQTLYKDTGRKETAARAGNVRISVAGKSLTAEPIRSLNDG